jgi:tetratricopeptide (TPR) repeat protein
VLTLQQRFAGLPPEAARRIAAIMQAQQRGDTESAERDLDIVLAMAPQHAEVLRVCGIVRSARGRHAEAIEVLLRARALRPDDAMIHNALAGAYERIGDGQQARTALRRACELGPEWAPCWFNYGYRLYVDGDFDAAVTALRHAVVLAPQHLQARTLLADALNAEGQSAQATTAHREIIAAHPGSAAPAWWGLATLRPMPLDADDIAVMQRLLAEADVGDSDRVTISFALAIALESQGEYARAFVTMQTAHALARRSEGYDAAVFSRGVDAILDAFPAAFSATGQGGEVIFVVSMPRSGSTLIEQILSAHSQVHGGAELNDLPQVVLQECNRRGRELPEWARTKTAQEWKNLGQEYLERTSRWRTQHPRHTDKLPGNWIYVGAIFAMLPEARVVVCRRDPLETCLGCYRYMFRRHPYTHDFADLARRWHDFDRAVRHWQALYPQRIRMQGYEDLLADPQGQIRALLAFCDLPFEEACLNFHAGTRRVTTPSAAQVREPLRRDTARAQAYGTLLDPLRDALKSYV